jgi:hypothetical protein
VRRGEAGGGDLGGVLCVEGSEPLHVLLVCGVLLVLREAVVADHESEEEGEEEDHAEDLRPERGPLLRRLLLHVLDLQSTKRLAHREGDGGLESHGPTLLASRGEDLDGVLERVGEGER